MSFSPYVKSFIGSTSKKTPPHPTPPEHHIPVYHESSDTGSMSGRGTADGIMGEMEVMVEGWSISRTRGR